MAHVLIRSLGGSSGCLLIRPHRPCAQLTGDAAARHQRIDLIGALVAAGVEGRRQGLGD